MWLPGNSVPPCGTSLTPPLRLLLLETPTFTGMTRPRHLKITLVGLSALAILLAAAVLPGWRHFHTAGLGHRHAEGAAGHSDPSFDGWHVHISFFGLELTIWEPGATEIATCSQKGPSRTGTVITNGEQMVTLSLESASPTSVSSFGLELAAPTARLLPQRPGFFQRFGIGRLADFALRCDAPEVPPPEVV